jgi:hypothetical protein
MSCRLTIAPDPHGRETLIPDPVAENAPQIIDEVDPGIRHSASLSLDGLESYTPDISPMIQAALVRIRTSLLK